MWDIVQRSGFWAAVRCLLGAQANYAKHPDPSSRGGIVALRHRDAAVERLYALYATAVLRSRDQETPRALPQADGHP